MGIKRKLANILKSILKARHSKKRRRRFHQQIDKYISQEKNAIPILNSEDEEAIHHFWGKYGYDVSTDWHRFYYAKTGQKRPDFIPDDTFYIDVKGCMNDLGFAGAWSDKAYLDLFIRGVKTPYNLLRNTGGRYADHDFHLVSFHEAQLILNQNRSFVVKPSIYTDTGKGVKLFHSPVDLRAIEDEYKQDFVIQLPLNQSPELAQLNASSVNTIRFNTVLFDTDAHVMSAFIKVGQAGNFADNSGHDRYFIGIHEDGTFADYAIDHELKRYDSIPSGFAFAGQSVPSYDKACAAVIKAHQCVPRFGFAFWDVCIDSDGEPVIVEMNLREPNTYIPQIASGPFFGDYTEEVLKFIDRR